jgi:Derlin-2/3
MAEQAVCIYQIYLSWPNIRQEWEIWRVWSSFFFVGGGFPALYDFFLIYRNGSSLEKETL